MKKRPLGSTGESLSVVGLGAIVFVNESDAFARDTVARAIDAGVNYFDMGPRYGGGQAEQRGGPALAPYRDRIFLAEKTGERRKQEAAAELRRSLKRMRTDHFDLYQFHAVKTLQEVQTIVGPGGAMEAFVDAKEAGLVRFLGFSAHTEEAALALMDHYTFDTILFPVNYVCWYQGHFGPAVLTAAKARGMGILALKALAKKQWLDGADRTWDKTWYEPVQTYEEARAALRWTLSRPVTSCVAPGHGEFLWWMIAAADQIAALTPQQEQAMVVAADRVEPIFHAGA